MSFANYLSREAHFKFCYWGPAGSGVPETLRYVHAKTRTDGSGKLISQATEPEPTLMFDFTPRGVDLRNMKARFHLCGVPLSQSYASSRELLLKGVDGLVLVLDTRRERLDANREVLADYREYLARHGRPKIPAVVQFTMVDDTEPWSDALLTQMDLQGLSVHPAAIGTGKGIFDALERAARLVLAATEHPSAGGLRLEDSARPEPSSPTPQLVSAPAPKVFLSYSHDSEEHRRRVLQLAQKLRSDGIDAWLDQFETQPQEGWPAWVERQFRQAHFVLVICTQTYLKRFEGEERPGVGRGVKYEAMLTQNILYDDDSRNLRFVPVLLEQEGTDCVPLPLRGSEVRIPGHYPRLLKRLAAQPVAPAPLGSLKRPARVDVEEDPCLAELRLKLESLRRSDAETSDIEERILERRRQLHDSEDVGVGTRLNSNKLELIEKLGQGGFATVWKAYDAEERRMVAVKVLHRQYRDDHGYRERFFRGAKYMHRLRHPNIVPVYREQGNENRVYYYTMKLIRGGDLAAKIHEPARIETCINVLSALARALAYAHDQGVLHRDVKPSNVLMTREGEPSLSDFDLVRANDTVGGTRTDGALGGAVYSAPEVLTDAKYADQRADVYGLAMLGVFMVLGAHPTVPEQFDVAGLTARLQSQVVHETLVALLSRGIQLDRKHRHASVQEFLNELEAIKIPSLQELVANPEAYALTADP